MKRKLRKALRELDRVDAAVARHYVYDGQLSTEPLAGPLSESGKKLRKRRLTAVAAVEAAGGRDPHPCFLRPPTPGQRAHWAAGRR